MKSDLHWLRIGYLAEICENVYVPYKQEIKILGLLDDHQLLREPPA